MAIKIMKILMEYSLEELEHFLEEIGIKKYRAKQILSWVYKTGTVVFAKMSDIPADLKDTLKKDFKIYPLEIIKKAQSPHDMTAKYLFKTDDGHAIEGVYLTENDREIVCISTQIGCPLECAFCASGKSRFVRNLSASEMACEVLLIKNDLKKKRINNIVFMGMGEPFLNYENVMKAADILRAHWGLGIGSRKITISTAGYVPGILRFAKEKTQIRLSVSLHAITDELRDEIMPINKKYPLKELLAALKEYVRISGRRASIEYTLIDGLNDSINEAKMLFKLTREVAHAINLIPLNRIDEFDYNPPPLEKQMAFQKILIGLGIRTTLRKEKGGDVSAACGQLRLQHCK